MRHVHGVADAWKVAAVMSERQQVLVTDAGNSVRLTLSACTYPADLTPDQARFIARALRAAAKRAELAAQGEG